MSRSSNRMERNRPANVLAGTALHAAARLEQGLELSDLEQDLLEVMRAFVGEEEIAACGQAYRQASPRTAASLFPEQISRLPVETPYTFEDLRQDLPVLAGQILAQPNVSIVDVSTLTPGQAVDSGAAVAAMVEYGGSAVTVLTGPAEEGPSAQSGMIGLALKPVKLKCVRDTNDQWASNDEIYWVSGAGSDLGEQTTYRSAVFTSLKTGQERTFPSDALMFSGGLSESVLINIECWEEDNGDIFDELHKHLWKISQKCADAAVGIIQHGDSSEAALAAVIAVVSALLTWLLGWLSNDDDLVGERSIAISRKAVRHLTNAQGGEVGPDGIDNTTFVWDFASNEGHYQLTARTTPVPFEDRSVYHRTWHPTNGWSPATALPGSKIPLGNPAVGYLNALLYLFHRDTQDVLQYRSYDGKTWSPYTSMGYGINSDLALANIPMGNLYCAYQRHGDFHLLSFTSPTTWRELRTAHKMTNKSGAPALAAVGKILHCVYPTEPGGPLNHVTFTPANSTFSTPLEIPQSGGGRDAALVLMGTVLCCVYRVDGEQAVRFASLMPPYDSWMARGSLSGSITSAPGLVYHTGKETVYSVARAENGRDLQCGTSTTVPWNRFSPVPASVPTSTAPAVQWYGDSVSVFYGR
ncbi:hypothetical protein [Streptomyces sp. NPDC056670]|uniref:hypothetical protein n=1 Tax=Streptomyces sp. NPDC056670 TaxID=3345904 RepID=UPI00368097EF